MIKMVGFIFILCLIRSFSFALFFDLSHSVQCNAAETVWLRIIFNNPCAHSHLKHKLLHKQQQRKRRRRKNTDKRRILFGIYIHFHFVLNVACRFFYCVIRCFSLLFTCTHSLHFWTFCVCKRKQKHSYKQNCTSRMEKSTKTIPPNSLFLYLFITNNNTRATTHQMCSQQDTK